MRSSGGASGGLEAIESQQCSRGGAGAQGVVRSASQSHEVVRRQIRLVGGCSGSETGGHRARTPFRPQASRQRTQVTTH